MAIFNSYVKLPEGNRIVYSQQSKTEVSWRDHPGSWSRLDQVSERGIAKSTQINATLEIYLKYLTMKLLTMNSSCQKCVS